MLVVHAVYQLKNAGTGKAFYDALCRKNIIEDIRKEDGCMKYLFSYPAENDTEVYLTEEWESLEKMNAHKLLQPCKLLQEVKAVYVANTQAETIEAK